MHVQLAREIDRSIGRLGSRSLFVCPSVYLPLSPRVISFSLGSSIKLQINVQLT